VLTAVNVYRIIGLSEGKRRDEMQSTDISNTRLAEMIAEQNRWLAEEERIEMAHATAHTISYSDGTVVENAVIQIWDDLHTERSGYYRAFWCASKDASAGSPVIGYCSPGGSRKTVKACAAEVRRMYPDAAIYRNGREVK
jgi:hypothetical protein